METALKELKLGLRALLSSPGFTTITVLSIALAIGSVTTVFTWLENLILNPFPVVSDTGRLVVLAPAAADGSVRGMPPISYPVFRDWQSETHSYDGMMVHRGLRLNVRVGSEAMGEPVWGELVSGNFFDVLGVAATRGRALTSEDEHRASPVAVVSHDFWQRKLGGDAAAVGRVLTLNGSPVTVVGVAPADFGGVVVGLGYDLWVPLTLGKQVFPGAPALPSLPSLPSLEDAKTPWLQAVGRLRPGIGPAEASLEIRAVARKVSESRGETPATSGSVRLVRETQLGSLLTPLLSVMLLLSAFVLLNACANVTNLLLARATIRERELGIRLALGANRRQVVARAVSESVLLTLAGGTGGLLLATWSAKLLKAIAPLAPLPVQIRIETNATVIGFALLATLITSLMLGLLPILRAMRVDVLMVLADRRSGRGIGRSGLRRTLVVSQIALSLVSLASAGLFVRSLGAARAADLGFVDPERVLLVSTDLGLPGVLPDTILERSRSLPGVASAAFSTMVPLGFGGHAMSATRVDGYEPARDEDLRLERVVVSDGYFETMEIPIRNGRGIAREDRPDTLRVAVVNEAFADRFYRGADAVGRRIDPGGGWVTIVGVAENSTYRDLGESAYPVIYVPLEQTPSPAATLHLKTSRSPASLLEPLRREFAAIHPDLPVLDPRTLAAHMEAASFVQYLGASMLSAFGSLAIILAGIGVYGALSFYATERRREIAIRCALGASSRDVQRAVVGQGLRLAAWGTAAGAFIAIALGRLMRALLLGVSPTDLFTYAVVVLLLGAVSFLACLVPARRAARIDPALVLRSQ